MRRFLFILWLVFLTMGRCEQPLEVELETPRGFGTFTAAETVCANGSTTFGIDVSKYQETINWDLVASDGVKFAFIRVSDGLTYIDLKFERNWAEAKRVGIIRGAYQFLSPTEDPIQQADLVIEKMGTLEPTDLPPVIDVEETEDQSPETITERIHQWVSRIESQTGRIPIIYTGGYFWNTFVKSADFARYPLWVPQWGPECPNIPTAWSSWAFFQYTSHGEVAGIGGNVDLDKFNGDLTALMAFIERRVTCGDHICSGGETEQSCPIDCGCAPIPPLGRIVDEAERCFEKGGPAQYLRSVNQGWDNSLLWTHTTDNPAPSNYGIWQLTFEQAGRYQLEAYTLSPWAESKLAAYEVAYNGSNSSVIVDQSANDGWNPIGEFRFSSGGEQSVRLNDNTGEPNSADTQLVFDAIRLTRLDPPPEDAGWEDTDGSTSGDTAHPPEDGGYIDQGEPVEPDLSYDTPVQSDSTADSSDSPGNGNLNCNCQWTAQPKRLDLGLLTCLILMIIGLLRPVWHSGSHPAWNRTRAVDESAIWQRLRRLWQRCPGC